MARLEGDPLVLGCSGKMGPTLTHLARRAVEQSCRPRRVIGAARFSNSEARGAFEAAGIETVAVDLLEAIKQARREFLPSAHASLTEGVPVTDANAAFFEAANNYHGCIAGIHELLRRQGLLAGRCGLDPNEGLSPGKLFEIDQVLATYPSLNDDAFVRRHLDTWLPQAAISQVG